MKDNAIEKANSKKEKEFIWELGKQYRLKYPKFGVRRTYTLSKLIVRTNTVYVRLENPKGKICSSYHRSSTNQIWNEICNIKEIKR